MTHSLITDEASTGAPVEESAAVMEVLHIVPALMIGGVEVGIARSFASLNRHFRYRVFSLRGAGLVDVPNRLPWSAAMAWVVGWRRLFTKPGQAARRGRVIVSSLWPAHALVLVLRCLSVLRCVPSFHWVVFLHSTQHPPGLKGVMLAKAVKWADRVLCDAIATRDGYGLEGDGRALVAPYVFHDAPQRLPHGEVATDGKHFDVVVVGRADPLKRFDLVARLLDAMVKRGQYLPREMLIKSSDAKRSGLGWDVDSQKRCDIGESHEFSGGCRPPNPEMSRARGFDQHLPRVAMVVAGDERSVAKVREHFLGADVEITWLLNLPPEQVAGVMSDARFYLLLSDCEGFSLTTVEAVQAGCLPVVRPVGEVAHYLSEHAAVWVRDISPQGIEQVVEAMLGLANDPVRFQAVCARAQQDVRSLGCYEDGFVAACAGPLSA